ncbi:hypothetical protein K402DRAFT_396887, partial [Aulographum hederae CBS 113979]
MFGNPLFFIDERTRLAVDPNMVQKEGVMIGPNISEGLHEVLDEVTQYNKKQAQSWRSELFRLLDPPLPDETSGMAIEEATKRTKDLTYKAIARASASLVPIFVELSESLLEQRTSVTMFSQLEILLTDVALTAYKLSTRKTQLEIHYLHSIKNHRYEAQIDVFEPNALHREELDDNEKILDGRRILFVSHPLLIACGNTDGSDYNLRRVWKKATVWMGPSKKDEDMIDL